jgi:hypothetical protein
MTTSVPDGLSFDDLQNLFENASQEEDISSEIVYGSQNRTAEEITQRASDLLDEMIAFCDAPIAHKAMAMMILSNLIEWQTNVGEANDGNVGWLRDAGKAQACHQILKSITTSDDDFIADA